MDDLRISSFAPLRGLTKQICALCGKKRMYFCYDCRTYMPGVQELVPTVKLPTEVHIIKHPREKNGKSTALHALLLARSSTCFFLAPDVIDYKANEVDPAGTVVVYPCNEALPIDEYVANFGPIKRLIFLEATWFQVGGLRMLSQIQNLPIVKLKPYKTMFWRPQKGYSEEHLATIEAIYYALREVYDASTQEPYDGAFDDLLFWFFFFRSKIGSEVFEKNRNSRKRSRHEREKSSGEECVK